MPPRKISPVGAHVLGGMSGLKHATTVGAEALQVFVSNPRGWATPAPDPAGDGAWADTCRARRLAVYVHAPYLVNLASPTPLTAERSAAAVAFALERGARLGARGVVVHGGACVDAGHYDTGLRQTRELLLPLLDAIADDGPTLLVEPTAGGGRPLVARVEDLAPLFEAVEHHPRLGVCLDTCHAFAAGHDLATPGGVRATLNALVRTVGRGRLKLVHANDSRDPVGSGRDRHANIGHGTIGTAPFAELFRHPATAGVPVLVETPGDTAATAADIATLRRLRDEG